MTTQTSVIQIRVDDKVKKGAKKLFSDLGTDISGAFKMFLKQSIKTKSLAIKGLTENGFTEKEEGEIYNAIKDSYKSKNIVGRYKTSDDFIKSLKKK
jgi:addiction module RelB/DinJ family antitoxin